MDEIKKNLLGTLEKKYARVIINECSRCGHSWIRASVNKKPKQCPKCKSKKWDEPDWEKVALAQFERANKLQKLLDSYESRSIESEARRRS